MDGRCSQHGQQSASPRLKQRAAAQRRSTPSGTIPSVPTRAIRYNGVNHAFLDKVGVWRYADACIKDIAEVLRSQT